MENKQIDILDVLLILVKHKKFIFFTTLIVSIFAVIYSLVTPEIWSSTSSIMPTDNEISSFSFNSSLSGLQSSLLGSSFSSNGTNLVTVMNSRTFSEDVIEKFNLFEYFEITEKDSLVRMHEALKAFNSEMKNIILDEENGLINTTILSKDKYLSANIANYYVEKIEEYNLTTSKSKGKERRKFIEKRLMEVEKEIKDLSEELLSFQKKNKILALGAQVNVIIENYAKLEAEKNAIEIEREYLEKEFGSDTHQILSLDRRLEVLNNKIITLKTNSDEIDYIFELDEVADLSLQFATLTAQLEIKQKLYEFLYPQYESAKLEELKDLATIEIIDKARPAGLRTKPKRAILCIIAFILSIIVSSIFTLFMEALRHKSTGINKLKDELFSKKK